MGLPANVTEFKMMQHMADQLVKSGMLPNHFNNIHKVIAGISIARELGLPELMTLNNIAFINGKLSLSGQMMLAVVRKSGEMASLKVIERTDLISTVESTRKNGDSMRVSFTMEDAKRAALTKSGGNYDKYPRAMLYWRAISELCRALYSDVIFGLYTPEEIESGAVDNTVQTPEGDIIDISPSTEGEKAAGSEESLPPPPLETQDDDPVITQKQANLYFYKMKNCKFTHEEMKEQCGFDRLKEMKKSKFDAVLKFIDANQKEEGIDDSKTGQ